MEPFAPSEMLVEEIGAAKMSTATLQVGNEHGPDFPAVSCSDACLPYHEKHTLENLRK